MRLGFSLPSLSKFSPIFSHYNPVQPISSSSPTSLKPQTPLFLRPPTHSTTLSHLQKWQNWAKTLASSVTSTDNGPDTTLLLRELNWLIEDALENPKSILPQLGNEDMVVTLRAELKDLYVLWKQRIEERRPFQYVVGCEHWRDLVLSVEEGVLIPRPETELVVDLVSDVVEGNEELRDGLWADLGTGSGALAIGIGRVLGTCGRVVATDLSPVAVEVASYNVQRYNLQDKIEIKLGSWFEPLKNFEGELAGLVSNPPYIPSEHISGLQAEVAKHEPRLALDGGANGMDDLLHLCCGTASLLKPGGFFAFETNGEKQCKFLVDYMKNELKGGFCDVDIVLDFAGKERFVTGFRSKTNYQ
ncbi:Release factor glutamine methyltransferase [Camellia lanceoleosa]|nr:Release factor glutamine methyltransferase [Camellia lanceoleosa]